MEISAIDVKNSCRTCLSSNQNLESLFESTIDGRTLANCLISVAPINIASNDGLSEFVCEICKANLIRSFRFQELCIASDKNIRILIEKSIHNDLTQIQIKSIKTEKDLGEDDVVENIAEQLSVSLENEIAGTTVNDKPIEHQLNNAIIPTSTTIDSIDTDESSDSENENSDEDSDEEEEQFAMEDSTENEAEKGSLTNEFKCDQCERSFKTQAKLEKHHKIHELGAGKKRKNSQSPQKRSAAEDDSDGDDKTYECKLCPKIFKKPSLLSRHVKTHDPNKRPFECNKCDKRFPSQVALVRHDILHSDLVERSKLARDESQEFTCVVCGKMLKTPESLTSHLKGHKADSSQIQQYSCRLCLEFFQSLSDLVKHSKSHIENATHQCAICNKMFAMGDELIDHMLRHKGMKPHQCHICEKSFLKLHKLNVHMRTHSDDKPFLCPECGKSLSTNENLKRHLIRHTGIKPYACNLCPSRFVFKSGLTSHMSTHTGLKPFICDICGSSFTKSSSLTKHHRIHTGERPYVCEVCGMRFNSSDHVKRHMRTHTGERPYKCQYCDRSYAQSNDLLKHTRIHVGENTYRCNLCTQAFRLQAQLREHYRVHYDATIGREDAEMKPQIMPDNQNHHNLTNLVLEQHRREQQMNFPHYNMIKHEHENKDILMDQDDQSSVKSYHDLSMTKKHKLE